MIVLQDITREFRAGGRLIATALSKVSCRIEAGSSYALTGASGSGKSTLLNILAGLLMPSSGSYRFQEQDMVKLSDRRRCRVRNRQIGVVVQDFALLEDETALSNCVLPALMAGQGRRAARERALLLLEGLGVGQLAHNKARLLSGGERQRVAIARAMMNEPALLLADEPTGALDSENTDKVMEALCRLCEGGTTLIVATHNLRCADYLSHRIHLKDGRIVPPPEGGKAG